MDTIGLIAGNRRFPLLFCEAARARGVNVIAVAIKGETSRHIARYADTVHWIKLGEFERAFEIFRQEKISKVVMAGQVSPRSLFKREVRESKSIRALFDSIADSRANTIFSALAQRLADEGLTLIDSTTFLGQFVPAPGVLTRRQPSESQWKDIRFGMDLAKKVAGLDIGLTVAVKHQAIVAVEALEGTDNLIRRAGRICKGLVIAKAGRPAQDMRFDIPVIGLNTIKTLIRAQVTCLAIEAQKTLIIDMQSAVALADRKGIAVVSI